MMLSTWQCEGIARGWLKWPGSVRLSRILHILQHSSMSLSRWCMMVVSSCRFEGEIQTYRSFESSHLVIVSSLAFLCPVSHSPSTRYVWNGMRAMALRNIVLQAKRLLIRFSHSLIAWILASGHIVRTPHWQLCPLEHPRGVENIESARCQKMGTTRHTGMIKVIEFGMLDFRPFTALERTDHSQRFRCILHHAAIDPLDARSSFRTQVLICLALKHLNNHIVVYQPFKLHWFLFRQANLLRPPPCLLPQYTRPEPHPRSYSKCSEIRSNDN